MNKAILVGRLTKDPELKMTENTKREVCQFTIAVNRPYTNDDGERKADFINCVVWDKLAENLAKYQHKGNQIAVEGRIQTRNYDDKDGKKVYVTEIFVSNITFLDSKGSNDSVNNLEEPPVKPGPITTEQIDSMPAANDPFASFGNEVQINDSDLPF
ncbi:MAG: single-stranded DNA-binding protein [Bacilli bacterium]|nr:single-stranded DNA-binding protein [Bacilli bacterium]